MEDYLTAIKNKKNINENHDTAVDSEKLKEYQNYVTLIHKSFDILKEREFNLIEALKNCKDEKDPNHLYFHYDKDTSTEPANDTVDTYDQSTVEPPNYPEEASKESDKDDKIFGSNYKEDKIFGSSDKDDKIFPSADRAVQKLRTENEESVDQADNFDKVTQDEASLGDEELPKLITSAVTG